MCSPYYAAADHIKLSRTFGRIEPVSSQVECLYEGKTNWSERKFFLHFYVDVITFMIRRVLINEFMHELKTLTMQSVFLSLYN